MKQNYSDIQDSEKSHSQIGQDLKVLKFYKNKRNGYFIEAGANDGIKLSNTYLLEKNYNWRGICVEPVPVVFDQLKKNRKSINVNKALYDNSKDTVNILLNPEDNELLAGVKEDMDKHKDRLKSKKSIDIKTTTLTELLDKYNAPRYIEYLSLDTEGSEYKILNGIDFNKYKFGYINIEHNYTEPRRTNMRKKLEENGYKYYGENSFDDIYIHPGFKTLESV